MPRYDYQCPKCGLIERDIWASNWTSSTGQRMPVNCACGGEMERLPCAPNFSVKGFNAKNNYGVKNDTSHD